MKGVFLMAYRYGNRTQLELFPANIEDYVSSYDPVRAYDAFVEALDFKEVGIVIDEGQVGNPEYNPKAMVKLLTYGYSYGNRSSRKLERATYHNLAFIWLMGGLKPDHKTIAEFRRRNKNSLKNILKQCARLCIKLDLIAGNMLFSDGTKIRANASIKNTWTEGKCERYLKHIDEHIESILSESEAIDKEEDEETSLVKMKESLREKETLKAEVMNILKELKQQGEKSINTVDTECTRINSIQGSHAGYNAQIVVDKEHGLIVSSDVVSKNNDLEQFNDQISQANETLGKKCEVACADSGYADTAELEKVDKQGIRVIVPSQRQVSEKGLKPFDKEQFKYDDNEDNYICPAGNKLMYKRMNKREASKEYTVPKSSICRRCKNFGLCTSSRHGRTISRLLNEEVRLKLETQYKQTDSQAIYKLRKEKVELPFGHIKRNLKVDAFLLRGRDGAKAEMSLLASCFNITRIISILGVKGFIQELSGPLQRGTFCFYRKRQPKQEQFDKIPFFMSKNVCLN